MSNPKNFDPSLLDETEPATEPEETTPEEATELAEPETPAEEQPDIYVQRRKKAKQLLSAALLVAAFLWFVKPWTGHEGLQTATSSNTVEETDVAAYLESDANTLYETDLDQAEEYYRQHGTFDNIRLDGAHVAARDTTILVARTVDETCYAYGIMDHQRLEIAPDPSGSACAGQIVAVQQQLDKDYEARTTKAEIDAETVLRKSAESVIFQTSRNFVDGMPSTAGLPATVDGALVVENTGEYVLLRVSHPGACKETYVTAAAEIGEINDC